MFYKNERIALFIDGAHLYTATKALKFDIDYQLLLQTFQKQGHLLRAFYYCLAPDDNDEFSIRRTIDWLDYNGYKIVLKPMRNQLNDIKPKNKSHFSMEIAVDMLNLAPRLDHCIVFAGDHDLCYPIDAMQKQGVRISAVATTQSNPPLIADELRRQIDNFIDLQTFKTHITRPQRETSKDPITHLPFSTV